LNNAIQFPGLTNAWTMPIKTRIDMLSTGIRTPVGIKIMGDDLQTLSDLGEEIEALVRTLPGTLSAFSERVTGGNYLDFVIDRAEIARYGLTVADVQDIIQSAIGGMNVTQTVEGLERYSVNIRYMRDYRNDLPALNRVLIPLRDGGHIPISQVADIQIKKGPPAIKSENARRTAWIYVDLQGIDVGTYVENARKAVAEQVKLPPGYNIVWSGQYEYIEATRARLMVIIPMTALIIFLLLYISTQSVVKTGIILLSVPFALVGAYWLMYLLGYNSSIGVAVGLIALAGLSAETGVVMLLYLDIAYKRWQDEGRMLTRGDLHQAVMYGAVQRIRPKAMTVVTIIVGLFPIMWSTGAGADVMKRIAAPMVGGSITSLLVIMLVMPIIYFIWRSIGLDKSMEPTMEDDKH
jgi:Cu(I)/Ag(I) efflux system membrane protein CusA/SilA